MQRHVVTVGVMALIGMLACPAYAQDPPPKEPFKTVHLTNLTPEQATALMAWMTDVNAIIAKAGLPETRYRLYKVSGKQAGGHAYLWESSWSGGDAYTKLHQSPEWKAVSQKHQGLDSLMKDEIYNRYIEITAARR